jgi:hypothetical protein
MDENFLESFINREHVVLGRKLHPFCLYDVLKLYLANSPFLGSESAETISVRREDLVLAVIICSTPFDSFVEATRVSFGLKRIAREFWLRRCRKMPLQLEVDKFLAYMRDFYAPPVMWTDRDSVSKIGAPWPLACAVNLLRNTNLPKTEIWTMPLGEAIWYSAAVNEQIGPAQIVSSDEVEAIRELGLKV